MDKSVSFLIALKEHLQLLYPTLTSWVPENHGLDTAAPYIGPIASSSQTSLIITLRSGRKVLKQIEQNLTARKKLQKDDITVHQGHDWAVSGPPFRLVFSPMAMVTQTESCRALMSVSLVTHHDHLIEKDFLTLILSVAKNSNVAADEESAIEIIESSCSSCKLLTKLSSFAEDGFTMCPGIRFVSHKSLQVQSVFIEPSPFAGDVVVRSRSCRFMVELPQDDDDGDEVEVAPVDDVRCGSCRDLELTLTDEASSVLTPEAAADHPGPEDVKFEMVDFKLENIEVSAAQNIFGITEHETRALLAERTHDPDDLAPLVDRLVKPIVLQTCQQCQLQFSTLQALNRHMSKCKMASSSLTISGFGCKKCGEEFDDELDLVQHLELCEDDNMGKSLVCVRCSEEFLTASSLAKHETKCKPKRKGKKKVLSRTKKKKVAQVSDNVDDLLTQELTCFVCMRHFTQRQTLDKHVQVHLQRTPDLLQQCQCPVWDCGQLIQTRLDLNQHFIANHSGITPLTDKVLCVICLTQLDREKLREHLRLQHPHQKFVCTECGRECLFPSQLKQHWKDMHDPTMRKEFICELCGNEYARSTGLKQHMLSQHSNQRDFNCLSCGKGFTNAQRLLQHERIHTGAKPFKCKLCEYRSNRSDNVLFHLRKVHKAEKPTVQNDVEVFTDEL